MTFTVYGNLLPHLGCVVSARDTGGLGYPESLSASQVVALWEV